MKFVIFALLFAVGTVAVYADPIATTAPSVSTSAASSTTAASGGADSVGSVSDIIKPLLDLTKLSGLFKSLPVDVGKPLEDLLGSYQYNHINFSFYIESI